MDDAEARLRAALPRLAHLGYAVRLVVGGAGEWVVDAKTAEPVMVPADDRETACTIRISPDNLLKLLDGRLDPMVGYSLGRIKVMGSKGVALKMVAALA
jgi:putative sterol carrier protein